MSADKMAAVSAGKLSSSIHLSLSLYLLDLALSSIRILRLHICHHNISFLVFKSLDSPSGIFIIAVKPELLQQSFQGSRKCKGSTFLKGSTLNLLSRDLLASNQTSGKSLSVVIAFEASA